jgi:ribosome maturation factor RimP
MNNKNLYNIKNIGELIQPIFDRMGVFLVNLELRGAINNQVLTILADTEDGITLEQITDLSREIADVLDINDPINGKYRLDVSSPGIDFPLKELWQFRKNLGKQLRVKYKENESNLEITGKLQSCDKKEIIIELNLDKKIIPLKNIKKAVVKVDW